MSKAKQQKPETMFDNFDNGLDKLNDFIAEIEEQIKDGHFTTKDLYDTVNENVLKLNSVMQELKLKQNKIITNIVVPLARKVEQENEVKPKQTTEQSSSEEEEETTAKKPAPKGKRAPAKKASRKITQESESESSDEESTKSSQTPKPTAKKAPPKKQSKKTTESDDEQPKKPAPKGKRAPAKKSKQVSDDEEPAPVPKGKRAPAKKSKPVSEEQSSNSDDE